jgi:hypothetical protein
LEEELEKGAVCHRLYSNCRAKEALEGFEEFKIGQVIRSVKYGDDLCYWLKKKTCYRACLID